MKKIGLVLEGGGLRGIFTAGVIDCFIDNNINFDYVVGVSAGSCNGFEYISKSRGFIKKAMLQTDKKNSFYGVRQMVESHKYVDLDKVFYEYTDMYNFDFKTFNKTKIEWEFVATNINTGKPEYLHSKKQHEAQEMGRASCSLPFLTSPVEINGELYLDGGVSDSIPIQRALDKGCDKVVVVCTRKKGSFSSIGKRQLEGFKLVYKNYPKFIKTASKRSELYKKQIKQCETLEKQDKVYLIRPTMPEVSRLESNLDELNLSYYHGYSKAQEYINTLKEVLK